MLIVGKRKRILDRGLYSLGEGTEVTPGIEINNENKSILLDIGFSQQFVNGETILPPTTFGPINRFNAEGKEIKQTDKPMETAYRQVEWHWEQWSGYLQTEHMSKIVDVPYERYPRTFVAPPSVELSIKTNTTGRKFVVAPALSLNFNEPKQLIHEINIFLEIFGYCQILTPELTGFIEAKIIKLNWTILPPGQWPWVKLEQEVKSIVNNASEQNQIVIKYRLKLINEYNPEFVAVGTAGFYGYLIFGFPERTLYVLESIYTGNATYVFEENWEYLSKLTKSEILVGNLQKERIIHRITWEDKIKRLL